MNSRLDNGFSRNTVKPQTDIMGFLEKYRKIALAHGGECLSDTYINSRIKLRFRCLKGHEFEAIPYNIKAGSWCPVCVGKKLLNPLYDLQQIAAERGGDTQLISFKRSTSKRSYPRAIS